MANRRRCRECRRLFPPNPHVKDRQHTCARPECQQARHKKGCAEWYRRQAAHREAQRVQSRIRRKRRTQPESSGRPPKERGQRSPGPGVGFAPRSNPTANADPSSGDELNWDVIEAPSGVQLSTILRELFRVLRAQLAGLERQLREEKTRQIIVNKEIYGRDASRSGRQ
jgi:hypothetical protein